MSELDTIAARHKRVGLICAGVVVGMLGMAYAAVPLYQLFCQVTGYAGTTQRAVSESDVVLEKTIEIRFDANISNALDWSFKPGQRSVKVKLGEKKQVVYLASNLAGEATYGTATFNVSPPQAGAYFNKLECFCFTEQKLENGESVEMPVIFFVDPEIAKDPLLGHLPTITLSYTFFPDEDAQRAAEEANLTRKKGDSALLNSPDKS